MHSDRLQKLALKNKNIQQLKDMNVDQLIRYKHKLEDAGQKMEENGHDFDSSHLKRQQKSIKQVQQMIDKKKELATNGINGEAQPLQNQMINNQAKYKSLIIKKAYGIKFPFYFESDSDVRGMHIINIAGRTPNPNPTPEQLKKREKNQKYLESLTPEKKEKLRQRQNELTKQWYRNRTQEDPDFILENREKALEYWRSKKEDTIFSRKERQRLRAYEQAVRDYAEKNDLTLEQARKLIRKKGWESLDDQLGRLLMDEKENIVANIRRKIMKAYKLKKLVAQMDPEMENDLLVEQIDDALNALGIKAPTEVINNLLEYHVRAEPIGKPAEMEDDGQMDMFAKRKDKLKRILAQVDGGVGPEKNPVIIDGKEVDVYSAEVDGIDMSDYPDFCDAFLYEVKFEDGTDLDEGQVEELMDKYPDVCYEVISSKALGI